MAPPLREMLTSTEPEHCNDRVYRQTGTEGFFLSDPMYYLMFVCFFITRVHEFISSCMFHVHIPYIVHSFIHEKSLFNMKHSYCNIPWLTDPVTVNLTVLYTLKNVLASVACMRACVCLFVLHWCPQWLRCHQWIDFQLLLTERGGCLSCG